MPCLCVTSSLGGVDGACGHWASPAWTAGSAQSVVKGQEWTCGLPEHQLLHLHWLHQSSGWYWAHFPLIIILWCLDSLIYNSQNLKTGLFFRNVTVVFFRHIYWKLAWFSKSETLRHLQSILFFILFYLLIIFCLNLSTTFYNSSRVVKTRKNKL